jgi:hypothetical protein
VGLWNHLVDGISGFRRGWLNADTLREAGGLGDFDTYTQYDARKFRYDLFWAFYQNNTFQAMTHAWSPTLKAQFGLYKHTRNIFCPGKRLGDFWGTYVYCGELDPLMGDGRSAPSSIPIEGATKATRNALAHVTHDSRWQVKKETWTRDGGVYGDNAIKIVDDPIRRKVTMKVVHPGHVKWCDRDDAGRVRSYILEEQRYDPRRVPFQDINPILDPRSLERQVTYNEECFVDGDEVVYRTFLNGALFDWRRFSGDGQECPAEWRVPYTCVPLILNQHQDINLDYGMGEFHSLISKVFEVDDLASGLGDQARKVIRSPWVIWGIRDGTFKQQQWSPSGNPDDPSWGRGSPAGDRQNLSIITSPDPTGRAQSLVADLPIQDLGLHIERINEEIERDYPELQMDIWASADVSGRALREARKRVVTKVQARRAPYDLALAEAYKIALYIQSVRGYEGAVSGVEHCDDPRIALAIGHRAVFQPDPLDDLEEDSAFWGVINTSVTAGVPLRFALAEQGWDETKLNELDKAKADEAAAALAQATAMTAALPAAKKPIGDAA